MNFVQLKYLLESELFAALYDSIIHAQVRALSGEEFYYRWGKGASGTPDLFYH